MLEFRPHRLRVKLTTGGGTSPNGDPIPVEPKWSDEVKCRFDTDSRELIRFTVDGPVRLYSYLVVLDPTEEDYEEKYVRLFDKQGNQVAEMLVQKQLSYQLHTKLYL